MKGEWRDRFFALKDGQVFQCNFGTFLRQNKLTTNKNKMYFFLP